MPRLSDPLGNDLGEIISVGSNTSADPDLGYYEVCVRLPSPADTTYEINGHPFVPGDDMEICARDTYGRDEHGPGPYSDPTCGYRVWPYGESNMCLLAPHQEGKHRDAQGRKFTNIGYPPKPANKKHCRRHLEFRSDCDRCVSENA